MFTVFIIMFVIRVSLFLNEIIKCDLYTLKNAGLFFQPKCWVETAGLGRWVVLT